MAKIVNIILPLKSHQSTFVKISEELRERGHEVVFAGMEDTRSYVESRGFRFISIFPEQFPAGFMAQWLSGPTSHSSWGGTLRFLLDERRKMIEHEAFVTHLIRGGHQEFQQVMTGIAPDLILVDLGLHAYWALLAWQSSVQTLYFSTILSPEEDSVLPPFNSMLPPGRDPASRQQVKLAWDSYFKSRRLNHWGLRLLGIPNSISQIKKLARICGYPLDRLKLRTLLFPLLELPKLILCPKEFEFSEGLTRPNRYYIDFAVNLSRPEAAFPWERLEADKQLIFASLGSVAYNQHFFQQMINAAAEEPDWQLVLNIGPRLTPADFVRVPSNAILVNGAPQLGLLQRAKAMVNHGGINSVGECIYFGVPQVVFPIGFDQPGAAARVQEHKLGVVSDFRSVTSATIRALVTQVLNDASFRQRAQAMSQTIRARQTQPIVAQVIESFL